MADFAPTHEFVLHDGTVIKVQAELRGDWVAFEADGTCWSTVMGDLNPWWSCSKRDLSNVRRVIKYGHRFLTIARTTSSHRFECECGERGRLVRSDDRAAEKGRQHHADAIRVQEGWT